ncbi:MAG: ribonuclease E activity regulator RraA [Bdellovibrionales bacterium]
MKIAICDISDAHPDDVHYLDPVFHDFGGTLSFHGPVSTVKCLEDNSKLSDAFDEPGNGRVLVVDGAGSLKRALCGGNQAAKAAKHGWAGVIIYGAIRDTAELSVVALGVKALAAFPLRPKKEGAGERDVPITIAGQMIRPGDYIYADGDGIIVADKKLHT